MIGNYKKSQLEQLRAFAYLIETHSIINASRKMNISPSSVSMYIQSFEKAVNMPLFDRTNGKKLIPYPACDDIYIKAKEILRNIDDIYINLPNKNENLLRIACHPLVEDLFMTSIKHKFISKNPNIEIYTKEIKLEEAINALLDRSIEIAIFPINHETLLRNKSIQSIQLWEYKSRTFCHIEHPVSKMKDEDIGLSDIFSEKVIIFNTATYVSQIKGIGNMNPYTNCSYSKIVDTILDIKGFIPMDHLFLHIVKNRIPNWKEKIVIKNTEHTVHSTHFKILYLEWKSIYMDIFDTILSVKEKILVQL